MSVADGESNRVVPDTVPGRAESILDLAAEAREMWDLSSEGDDQPSIGLAYRCGELAMVERLRDGGEDVTVPEPLTVYALSSAFKAAGARLLLVTLVLRSEEIIIPTAAGLVAAYFLVTRNRHGDYRAHWGLHENPEPFGDAYRTFAQAEAAYEDCRKAFLEATVNGDTLFGIDVPKFEVVAKVWPPIMLVDDEPA